MKNVKLCQFIRQLVVVVTLMSAMPQNVLAESGVKWGNIKWSGSLDVGNRYLFRSQGLGNDAATMKLEVMGATAAGQLFGGSLRGIRGPVTADTVTHLFAGQEIRFVGFDFSVLAEYLYWHHSDYRTMTPVGFSVQKDWLRALVKQDLADGGDQHLEINIRAFKKKRVLLAVSFVDTKSAQLDVVSTITTPDPDNPGTPILSQESSIEEVDLQYAALHGNFDINQHLRLYGIFYHHLKDQNDTSTWQLGLRWFFAR